MIVTAAVVLQGLGWTLIHLTWQVPLLAGTLRIAERCTRGVPPAYRCRVALLAFVALPTLGLVTAVLLVRSGAAGLAAASAGGGEAHLRAGAIRLVDLLAGAVSPLIPWLAAIWVGVVAVGLTRWAGGLWMLNRLVSRRSAPAPAEFRGGFGELVERLGLRRTVELRMCTGLDVPSVVGFARSTVLIPRGVFACMGTAGLYPILAHELAHVRRGDYWHNALQALVRILLVGIPGSGWISRQVDREREHACDDMAAELVGSRARYAASLARLQLARTRPHALSLSANGSSVPDRVRRIAAPAPRTSSRTDRTALALLLLASTATVLLGSTNLASVTGRHIQGFRSATPSEYTIRATDPAGEFTLSVRDGIAIRATVDGQPLPGEALVQRQDEILMVPEPPHRPFTVHLVAGGGIRWQARSPRSP